MDEKKIALNPAYELSFLKKEKRVDLLDAMDSEQPTTSLPQAQRLKKYSQEGIWPSIWGVSSWVRKRKAIWTEWHLPLTPCGSISLKAPKELFDLLADDYQTYLEIELTKGKWEMTEDDEREADALCKRYLERWKEEQK